MALVEASKQTLQIMREEEWKTLLNKVSICNKRDIPIMKVLIPKVDTFVTHDKS